MPLPRTLPEGDPLPAPPPSRPCRPPSPVTLTGRGHHTPSRPRCHIRRLIRCRTFLTILELDRFAGMSFDPLLVALAVGLVVINAALVAAEIYIILALGTLVADLAAAGDRLSRS